MRTDKLYSMLNEQERTRVLAARDKITDAELDDPTNADINNPHSAIADIFQQFTNLEVWQFSPNDPSVQRFIVDRLPTGASLYAAARKASREVLFDAAFEMICGLGAGGWKRPDTLATLENWRDHTSLMRDPLNIVSDTDCAAHLAARIVAGGSEFLHILAREFYNASRRSRRVPVDMKLMVMARHWVDPHCPLWMMSLPALEGVLRQITTNGSWSPETIRDGLKKMNAAGALRFPGQPIIDVQFGGGGWMGIERFAILGAESSFPFEELDYRVVIHKNRKRQ